jgi:glutathione S-transferase
MKLRYSPTSPYVRKVMVAAIELGLADGIELLPTNVWDPETDIATHNPLGKVPALVIDDGTVLYDSPVIIEYLDSIGAGAELIPAPGAARWEALRRQALGDGIDDAAVLRLLEGKRPPGEKSEAWIGRQKVAVDRSLDELEREADSLGEAVTVGHIAIGCALGYLDFRFAEDNWRAERPALADWYDGFSGRRSMMETVPEDPA